MCAVTRNVGMEIEDAMARADVLPFRERSVLALSGGERARVLLARALAVDASANPDTELANTFAQTQARYYLEHIGDLFVE
mgnify:CR=1 FL=1